jgi:hypothetical protein
MSKSSSSSKKDAPAAAAAAAATEPPKPPKRKAQRGGVTLVAKPAQEVGSAVVQQWQRTPLQMIQEYCQRQKRPKPMYVNVQPT